MPFLWPLTRPSRGGSVDDGGSSGDQTMRHPLPNSDTYNALHWLTHHLGDPDGGGTGGGGIDVRLPRAPVAESSSRATPGLKQQLPPTPPQ